MTSEMPLSGYCDYETADREKGESRVKDNVFNKDLTDTGSLGSLDI